MISLLFLFAVDPEYHTHAEVAFELDSIATHYSSITHLDTIGYSTADSLPIFAMKISDNVHQDEDEPAVLYVGCHHAEEILGVEICIYMINDLVSSYGSDSLKSYWVDNREIWFVPMLNAEGHGIVMSGLDTLWRKNKHDNNNNGFFEITYDGVDLNRNYDFYWDEGGSLNPPDEYYRGAAPFSENENRAIRDLSYAQNFVFCNSYHSARTGPKEVIYYPWRWGGGYSPDVLFIRDVADSMGNLIIQDDGTGHYTPLIGVGLDGTERNWLYGVCGTFAYTLEVSTYTLQPGWMVEGICQRNSVGAYFLLNRVEGSGITGCIYDSLTGEPLTAEVIIEDSYSSDLPPRRSEPLFGRFRRILMPDVYNVTVKKYGYVSQTFDSVLVNEGEMTQFDIFLKPMAHEIEKNNNQDLISITPNPTNHEVSIHLSNAADLITLKIYDINGRLVAEFNNPASDLVWQCEDDTNRAISNGIYVVYGETSEQKLVKKLVVLN